MTTYRDRLIAGDHDAKKIAAQEKAAAKTKTPTSAKQKTTAKKT